MCYSIKPSALFTKPSGRSTKLSVISTEFHCFLLGMEYRKRWVDVPWLLSVIKSALLAIICLLMSACLITWLTNDDWGKWVSGESHFKIFFYTGGRTAVKSSA